jgi:hypothetical protein
MNNQNNDKIIRPARQPKGQLIFHGRSNDKPFRESQVADGKNQIDSGTLSMLDIPERGKIIINNCLNSQLKFHDSACFSQQIKSNESNQNALNLNQWSQDKMQIKENSNKKNQLQMSWK